MSEPSREPTSGVVDLLAALQRSVDAAKAERKARTPDHDPRRQTKPTEPEESK